MDQMMLRFSRFFIRHRLVNMILIGAATGFFAYKAAQLQVFAQFLDLLPRKHPFIQVYEKFRHEFGSANEVVAAIVATHGTIYNERVLEDIYGFTDQIDKVPGVDHGQILSLTSLKVQNVAIDEQGTITFSQILGSTTLGLLEAQFDTRRAIQRAVERGESPPHTLAELKELVTKRRHELSKRVEATEGVDISTLKNRAEAYRIRTLREQDAELQFLSLRLAELPKDYRLVGTDLEGPWGSLIPPKIMQSLPNRVHENEQYYGRIVSRDDTAALVTAGFLEGRVDYAHVFNELHQLKLQLQKDGAVHVELSGLPIVTGWIFHFLPQIVLILGLTLGILVLLLAIYFRRWYGIVMPLSGALVSAIWGLGFISLMGYQLNPLILVIPMLITARAISHSVQFVERFYEEYERLRDKEEAVISSMAELLLPGTLAIVTDAFGIFVIGVSSIALMKKVAIFGAFWAMSIIVTEMLLNRLLIVYFPAPKQYEHYTPGAIRWVLRHLAKLATGRVSSRVIFVVWVAIVLGSFAFATRVKIGEAHPGTPILWPNSEFNRSTKVIADKFYGTDDLTVFVESDRPGGIFRPGVMREIEDFQNYMQQTPKAGGTLSIVDFLKTITRVFHNTDPRFYSIPYTDQAVGTLLSEITNSNPHALDMVMGQSAQEAAVHVFYSDHQGTTIDTAIHAAERYIRNKPIGRVWIHLVRQKNDFVGSLYNWLGTLLPPRAAGLEVKVRDPKTHKYTLEAITHPNRQEPPPPDSTRWILTLPGMTKDLQQSLVDSGYTNVQKIASADPRQLEKVEGLNPSSAYELTQAAQLDRRHYTVTSEWQSKDKEVHAEVRRRGLYENPELWVQYQGGDWVYRASGNWSNEASYALASGQIGVLAASNDEVEHSNNATFIASFSTVFLVILLSYRSLGVGLLMIASLGTASLISLAYMWFANIGFDVNTLPVQALGVGVGVDYALYIMDRMVHERKRGHSLTESIEIAIQTTGMAVFFTGSTLVGGIILWYPLSSLRFEADMSLLLCLLLVANLFGAILLVPALTALFKPKFAREEAPPTPKEPSAGSP